MLRVVAHQLIEILRKGPHDHPQPRHEAVGLGDRVQFPDGAELVQHKERRKPDCGLRPGRVRRPRSALRAGARVATRTARNRGDTCPAARDSADTC